MMTRLALDLLLVGMVIFGAVGLTVGVFLLRELRRSEEPGAQGLLLGAIFVGGGGLLMIQIGHALGREGLGPAVLYTGEVAMHAGVAVLAAFVWRVFRPSGFTGVAIYTLCVAALACFLTFDLLTQRDLWAYDNASLGAHLNQLGVGLPFVWAGVESLLEWLQSKRRLALGLATAGACRRFLLCSIACFGFGGIALLAVVAGETRAAGLEDAAALCQLMRAALYVTISTIILVLCFRPQWIDGEARAPGEA